jgi:prepilin signal peptidase PulO-like enzyme (type II secretory pathway)
LNQVGGQEGELTYHYLKFSMTVYFIYFFIFFFGLTIGSFLNCLIYRLPRETSRAPLYKGGKMSGRSYCPKCKKQISWYDNIPVLSFALLKGRCRHCGKKISWQYPIVELAAGLLFLMAFNFQFSISNFQTISNFQFSIINFIELFKVWFLVSVMIVIFVIDLRWYLILDIVTLPSAAIVFLLNLILGFSWQNLLISGIIGSSFFLIQFIVSKGRWIGGGDIRLGLLMGFALGWPNVLIAIFLAYFIGSFVGIGLILAKKKDWNSKVPLGIFLSVSTIVVLFYGGKILEWHFTLL